eukprot:5380788-Alexandrium_andersonii.AAC.1
MPCLPVYRPACLHDYMPPHPYVFAQTRVCTCMSMQTYARRTTVQSSHLRGPRCNDAEAVADMDEQRARRRQRL